MFVLYLKEQNTCCSGSRHGSTVEQKRKKGTRLVTSVNKLDVTYAI